MFDLEKSVAKWRKQMLAAGIKAPVPLNELESHLREEIERQIQSGASEQEAFQRTVLQIGQAKELKAEFVKDRNLLSLLGDDKFTAIDRILGTLWLVIFSRGFVMMSHEVIRNLISAHGQGLVYLISILLLLLQSAICGAGILGSALVIRGRKSGRWIIGIIAGLYGLLCLSVLLRLIPTVPPSHFAVVKLCTVTAFFAITVWLLFLPLFSKPKPAKT